MYNNWEERYKRESLIVKRLFVVFFIIRVIFYLAVAYSIFIRHGLGLTIIYIHVCGGVETLAYLILKLHVDNKINSNTPVFRSIAKLFNKP